MIGKRSSLSPGGRTGALDRPGGRGHRDDDRGDRGLGDGPPCKKDRWPVTMRGRPRTRTAGEPRRRLLLRLRRALGAGLQSEVLRDHGGR